MTEQFEIEYSEVVDANAVVYAMCVAKAREFFTTEQAQQSAAASIFINVNREGSTARSMMLQNRKKADADQSIPPAVTAWLWHYRHLVERCGPRMKAYIVHLLKDMAMTDPSDIDAHVRDYAARILREQHERICAENKPACGLEDLTRSE